MIDQQSVFYALGLLTPVEPFGLAKRLLGTPTDGGIVILDDIYQSDKMYSFGNTTKIRAEYHFAQLSKSVFLFDPNLTAPFWNHKNFTFQQLRLWRETIVSEGKQSLADIIRALGHDKRTDLIGKFDLAGEEYEVLSAVPNSIFEHFTQIVVTIHSLGKLADTDQRARYLALMTALRLNFDLVHVHANNHGDIIDVNGFSVPDILDLTFVRKGLVKTVPNATVYPTTYDHPCNPQRPDHLLWFYPFLPTAQPIHQEAYVASMLNASRVQEDYTKHLMAASLDYHVAQIERQLAVARVMQSNLQNQNG